MTQGTLHIELNLLVISAAHVIPIVMAAIKLPFTRSTVSDTHAKHPISCRARNLGTISPHIVRFSTDFEKKS